MGITCPEDKVTIPLYISRTIVFDDTLSLTQQNLEDYLRIVLTSPYDWDPHSVRFPKGSHIEEKEDVFTCIAAICVDVLRSKVHETEIEIGLCNTVHDPSHIVTRIVS